MKTDISGLYRGGLLPIDYEADFSGVEVTYGEKPLGDVKISGKIENRHAMVLELTVSGEYNFDCDRCGESFTLPFSYDFEGVIVREDREDTQTVFITAPDGIVDIDEQAAALILLNAPGKHLCKETCKGLCVKCGKNLNLGRCECEKPEIHEN